MKKMLVEAGVLAVFTGVVELLFRQALERYKSLEVRDEDIKAEEMRESLVRKKRRI